jgi:arabinofuranosyltransferase
MASRQPTSGSSSSPGPRADRAVFLVAGAVVVFLILTLRLWTYVVDDAFISLRYAKHLAEGQGLVYNVGERVEGYTNLLWTLLLSVAHLLPGDVIVWTKLFSVAAALVAAWGTARLGSVSGLIPSDWTWLPATLWLLLPVISVSAAEGLETMLFSALLIWSLVATYQGRSVLTGLAIAALTLTRPDGILVAPFALAWLARRQSLQSALWAIATLVPILVGVELWRVTYYGDWLPNTLYAKTGGSWWLLLRGARSLLSFGAVAGAAAWLFAVPALRRPAARLLGFVALTRVAFHLWSGGPWMGEHRFLVPTTPLVFVLTVSGLLTLTRHRLAVALVSALLLLPGWFAFPKVLNATRAYGEGLRAAHIPLGRLLDKTLPPSAVIACADAGAIAYYTNRTAIDILGLNDRHIAHRPGLFSKDKQDADYVLSRRPDVIVLLASAPTGGRWLTPADAGIAAHPTFIADYEPNGVWRLLAQYYLIVYWHRRG